MTRRQRFWLSPLAALSLLLILGQLTDQESGQAWIGWIYIWTTVAAVGFVGSVVSLLGTWQMVNAGHLRNGPLRIAQMLQTMAQASVFAFTFKLLAGAMALSQRYDSSLSGTEILGIQWSGWIVICIVLGLYGFIAILIYMGTELRAIRRRIP